MEGTVTEIDLGDNIVFKVTYAGKEFRLREPTVREVQNFKDKEEGADLVTELLTKLGMPKEVLEEMPVSKIKKLIDGIVGGMSEKK
jgi:hypothetical protein